MQMILLGVRVMFDHLLTCLLKKIIMNFGIQLNLSWVGWSSYERLPWWKKTVKDSQDPLMIFLRILSMLKFLKNLSQDQGFEILVRPLKSFKHFAQGSCLDIWRSWGILANIKRHLIILLNLPVSPETVEA